MMTLIEKHLITLHKTNKRVMENKKSTKIIANAYQEGTTRNGKSFINWFIRHIDGIKD